MGGSVERPKFDGTQIKIGKLRPIKVSGELAVPRISFT